LVGGRLPRGVPGGLIVAEGEEAIGTATLALPDAERRAVVDLIDRYGSRHPTGAITLPDPCLEAVVQFTSRTSSGHLREATATVVRPPF
jgi:hypothetical protein